MTGKLINIGQEWFIEYDKNGENKIYELSPESVLWTKKYDVDKILNENKDFKSPSETEFNLPGKTVLLEMNKILEKLIELDLLFELKSVLALKLSITIQRLELPATLK